MFFSLSAYIEANLLYTVVAMGPRPPKTTMFNIPNSLIILAFLFFFVLAVAGSEGSITVGGCKGVENSKIKN